MRIKTSEEFVKFLQEFGAYKYTIESIKLKVDEMVNDIIKDTTLDWDLRLEFKFLKKNIDNFLTNPRWRSVGKYMNKVWGVPKNSFSDSMEQAQDSVVVFQASLFVFEELVKKYAVDYVGELKSKYAIDLNSDEKNVKKSLKALLNTCACKKTENRIASYGYILWF